jgi:hypothetical protein
MSRKKLTEACTFAMRYVAEGNSEIYNRTVAANLIVVAALFPHFVTISRDRPANAAGARPLLAAALTPRGHDFITPRKLRRAHQ